MLILQTLSSQFSCARIRGKSLGVKPACLAAAVVSLLGVAPSLHAATYYWDGTDTTANADGGSGTWDTTATNKNWDTAATGGTATAWSSANEAVFGGADGTYTVLVGVGLTAQKILFSNSGYTLSAGSALNITLNGSATGQPSLAIASGKTATIGNNVTVLFSGGNLRIGADDATLGGTLNIDSGGRAFRGQGGNVLIDGVGTIVNVNTGGLLDKPSSSSGGYMAVGQSASSDSTLNVAGGTVSVAHSSSGTDRGLFVGDAGQGTVTITDGTITISANSQSGLTFGRGGSGKGNLFNLDGGTLTTSIVRKGAAGNTATFNFNGGTLTANASTTTFMQGLDTANVKAGGAKIDTGVFNITIGQALVANSASGGLTKSGSGTLTFTNSNTYTGATNVNVGTLVVNGSLTGTSSVTVASTATLKGSGAIAGPVTVQNGGTLATGNSIESMASGALTLESGSIFAYELDNDALPGVAGDLTYVTGNLSIDSTNNATLTLTELGSGSWALGEKLTLISYSGSLTNNVASSVGLFKYLGSPLADDSTFSFSGATWKIDYNDTSAGTNFTSDLTSPNFVTIEVVPEPTTLGLLALGGLGLSRRRRMVA